GRDGLSPVHGDVRDDARDGRADHGLPLRLDLREALLQLADLALDLLDLGARLQRDGRLVELRGLEVALDLRSLPAERLQLDLLVRDLVRLRLHERLGDELLLAREPLVPLELVARALD